jgi:hypothetical protein
MENGILAQTKGMEEVSRLGLMAQDMKVIGKMIKLI